MALVGDHQLRAPLKSDFGHKIRPSAEDIRMMGPAYVVSACHPLIRQFRQALEGSRRGQAGQAVLFRS